MSVASEITRLQNAKANLKTSLNAKNDSEHQITDELIDEYSDFVDSIQSGGSTLQTKSVTISTNGTTNITPDTGYDGMSSVNVTTNVPLPGVSVAEKDVNFYDYDGTRIYAYTKAEFLALSEYPTNPTHTGLTSQGWNWTLSDAQTYVTNNGKLDIGQMYITDDGATRLYIELQEDALSPYLTIGFQGNGSATVDWGDGNTETISANNTFTSVQHIYTTAGNYIISIKPTAGSSLSTTGTNTTYSKILSSGSGGGSTNYNHVYQNAIKKVELGSGFYVNAGLGNYAFSNCRKLETITLPNYIGKFGSNAFQNCCSLKAIVLPNSLTEVAAALLNACVSLKKVVFSSSITNAGGNALDGCYSLDKEYMPSRLTTAPLSLFNNCYSIREIIIPEGITTIQRYFTQYCYTLTKLEFPSTITSIIQQAFQYCYGMRVYDFSKCTTVPTLGTNVFNGIASGCKIIVPDDLYDTWIAATNWSNYASYIVKASEV